MSLEDKEARSAGELDRARQAERLVENQLFKEAVEACNDQIWNEFAASKLSDDETRRNARIALDLLNRLIKNLKHHIGTGKLADQTLVEIDKERKRLGIFKRHAKIS